MRQRRRRRRSLNSQRRGNRRLWRRLARAPEALAGRPVGWSLPWESAEPARAATPLNAEEQDVRNDRNNQRTARRGDSFSRHVLFCLCVHARVLIPGGAVLQWPTAYTRAAGKCIESKKVGGHMFEKLLQVKMLLYTRTRCLVPCVCARARARVCIRLYCIYGKVSARR